MDTFPTGSSSRCWQWSLQRTHTKRHFPLQQALSLSWPGVEDDGGKQLERHPAAAGDQFTISLVHADFLYENWKRPQQQKMNALLCLSAIKLVSPFLDCGQDNSLPRQGQHRQDQLRGVLRGRFFLDVPISKSLQVVGNTDIHTKMVVEVWVGTFVSEDRCKMKQSFAQKWKQPH